MTQPSGSPQSNAAQRLTLQDGPAELEVAANGGLITAFRWRRGNAVIDWLRPAPPDGAAAPGDSACYPLVPYSNRIREGRYTFERQHYQLARNFAPSPHSIHGHGWQSLWQVSAHGADHLTLTYAHEADDWPSAYRAEQRFGLAGGTLQVALSLTNTGQAAMPAGLGLHPYFPRSPRCCLTAPVERMWATDNEIMPTELITPPAGANPAEGLVPDATALDNCFTGFGGCAVINWPERRARLTLEADTALSFLVVFTPPSESFFCAEPVSHCTDAVNLAAAGLAGSGLRVLQPQENFTVNVSFIPQLDDAA